MATAASPSPSTFKEPLSSEELGKMHAYWRAANYLSVGQIYLCGNPLLREPLKLQHIKSRLLGHWGTTPGLNFIYIHLNRLIRLHDLNVIYITGPGHGGPGLVANTYLEGTYSEIYPNIPQAEEGLRKLFKQFSFPGGIPSHVAPETPGSIHEGGELGYSIAHAYGAAFDNPDLLVCCVVGDGESETGPLAGSWHSNKFLNPARDGAVLPILHLNGYKIANPTIPGRMSDDDLAKLYAGYGYKPYFVEGSDPEKVHQQMAHTLDVILAEIRAIQKNAREKKTSGMPTWPMIILRTPKGWTGPKVVDGKPVEGTWRAHQVPVTNFGGNSDHLQILENWMRAYKPEELFDEEGKLRQELKDLAPNGVYGFEAVGSSFVGSEHPEVFVGKVGLHDIAKKSSEDAGCFRIGRSWFEDFDSIVAELRDHGSFAGRASRPPLARPHRMGRRSGRAANDNFPRQVRKSQRLRLARGSNRTATAPPFGWFRSSRYIGNRRRGPSHRQRGHAFSAAYDRYAGSEVRHRAHGCVRSSSQSRRARRHGNCIEDLRRRPPGRRLRHRIPSPPA